MSIRVPRLLLIGLAACGGSDSSSACGLNAVVGPTVLLNEFNGANQTLATPPPKLPERMVVRLAAGPAYSAIVGRADSQWVIGVNGALPANSKATFGVLVLDTAEKPLGVMLYESTEIEGAPHIGTVSVGSSTVPLIGVRVDPARIQDARCPLFPDSLAQ
jgi:hypothetical protein